MFQNKVDTHLPGMVWVDPDFYDPVRDWEQSKMMNNTVLYKGTWGLLCTLS